VGLETSAEQPVPVRTVARLISEWVGRLGRVWVEGQVTQVNRRAGSGTVFLTLRDPVAEVSVAVTCPNRVYDAVQPPLADGARVVVHARPDFYVSRGTLSLSAEEIRPLGVGELLARLERLKGVLAAEGLFAADRKRSLPFLPGTVGLISGRGSAAERDVLDNARRRWPAVRFRVEAAAVQGPFAVIQVSEALRALDRDADVDVIVIARGGGSVEDLLPFSDESLVRLVATCRTPVVSAIGHEQDTPLLDLVADVRASTPTDAAKRVVPDVAEEQRRIEQLRDRARRNLLARVDREQHVIDGLRSRPALADPGADLRRRGTEVTTLRDRTRRCMDSALTRAADELAHVRARVLSLSPASTLERGYAVVQRGDGRVVRSSTDVVPGDALRVRLAKGELGAAVLPDSPATLG
jgi:exodeoxyribonuclease VII large subunit